MFLPSFEFAGPLNELMSALLRPSITTSKEWLQHETSRDCHFGIVLKKSYECFDYVHTSTSPVERKISDDLNHSPVRPFDKRSAGSELVEPNPNQIESANLC
jgi:hypothetical protein